MRILQVHNSYREMGGEDVAVRRDAALLRAAGHHVIQHQVSNPDNPIAATAALAVSAWNPMSHARIRRVVEESKPDLAHVHNTWFSMSASVMTALARDHVPTVMTLHNYRLMCANGLLLRDGIPCTLCVGHSPLPAIRYRCYRDSLPQSSVAAAAIGINRLSRIWRHVDTFITMSDFARHQFERSGIERHRLVVRPNHAVDPGPRPAPPSASQTVLFVGRLAEEKGARFITRVWAETASGDLQLRVIGDGPLRMALQNDHPEIEFVGTVDDETVAHEMKGARALLFPTLAYEGANPLVCVEAMSAGLPVLSSDLGAMSEVVGGAQGSRWLRSPGDSESWREGLEMVADDRLVDDAGDRARASFHARYTPAIALERLEQVYTRAAPRVVAP